jgi:hypothetical protein
VSIIGTTLAQALFIRTDAGVAVSYATKAAFVAAGWDIVWQDSDGVALDDQPTWTLSVGSAGRHVIGFTNPAGQWTAKITQLAANFSNPLEFSGEGLANDADTLYATLVGSLGVPATDVTTDGEVRIFDGDSLRIDFTVLETALAYVGADSLADCDELTAALKLDTENSDDDADLDTFTPTIISDTSGSRSVRVDEDAFPATLAVPDLADEVRARCDLRLVKGTRQVIAATRSVVVLWKAHSDAGP